jgi:hypothetical protein
LADNLAEIRGRIARAAKGAGREPSQVRLIAVTKTFEATACSEAFVAGIHDLGENYPQELRDKAPTLPEATWHFLGPLQSGTVRHVADHAHWIHTLAPGPAAQKVGKRVVASGRTIRGLLQVDFAGRGHGVEPADLAEAVAGCSAIPGIEMVGLMTLPPVGDTAEDARPFFARLRQMGDDLRERYPDLIELSMGMSLDYEVAVEEGATMVRIGTALFGERDKR